MYTIEFLDWTRQECCHFGVSFVQILIPDMYVHAWGGSKFYFSLCCHLSNKVSDVNNICMKDKKLIIMTIMNVLKIKANIIIIIQPVVVTLKLASSDLSAVHQTVC